MNHVNGIDSLHYCYMIATMAFVHNVVCVLVTSHKKGSNAVYTEGRKHNHSFIHSNLYVYNELIPRFLISIRTD